ncbi:MAG: thiamine phosphate synthase [Christensenellaceae bacterium]|nr:thiamine phosphate synthase [Christensenellaceae bacterium]
MFDILCVTNRLLCNEDFLVRIEKLAAAHPKGIILREKDLAEEEYMELAGKVIAICKKHGVPCILHSFLNSSKELGCTAMHLPMHILRELSIEDRQGFTLLGASCHSVEDAVEAEKLGCTYITAGHVFDTDCKKGLPGRGLNFLEQVCKSVSVPVYAIGGIDASNIAEVRKVGASGACIMSGAMQCENVDEYISAFKGEAK